MVLKPLALYIRARCAMNSIRQRRKLMRSPRKFIDALRAASPHSVTVEMGFEFRVESGQLTALLVVGGLLNIPATADDLNRLQP